MVHGRSVGTLDVAPDRADSRHAFRSLEGVQMRGEVICRAGKQNDPVVDRLHGDMTLSERAILSQSRHDQSDRDPTLKLRV